MFYVAAGLTVRHVSPGFIWNYLGILPHAIHEPVVSPLTLLSNRKATPIQDEGKCNCLV